jgi:hypothetical protein
MIKTVEIENIMKRVPHFQKHFNGFFMKTFNNIQSQKKKDRLDSMTNMVLDMKIIPLDPYYHDNFFFSVDIQEDMREFFGYLCSYNPWESVLVMTKEMMYAGNDVDNMEYICDLHDYLVHQSYFVSKYDLSVNTFQDMVQREFIHEYPSDYIPKSKDLGHEIYTKVQEIMKKRISIKCRSLLELRTIELMASPFQSA